MPLAMSSGESRPIENETLHIARLASTGRMALACAIQLHGLLDFAAASTLRLSHTGADRGARLLEEIRKVLVSASDITRQLLTAARRPEDAVMRVDLAELVDEMRPILGLIAGPDTFAAVVRDSVGAVILGNRGALEQVLVNLLVCEPGVKKTGRITISSGVVDWPGGEADDGTLLPPGVYAQLAVSDERCTMPPPPVDMRCDVCGTVPAIGLPLVAAIARAHGGGLVFHRTPSGALEHRVLFPAAT
jgi:hypothetical protein